MSKITNDGLTWSGTGRCIAVAIYGNSGRQRVDPHGADIAPALAHSYVSVL